MLEKTSLAKLLIFYNSNNIHNHYPLDIKAVPYLLTFHSNTLDHSSAKDKRYAGHDSFRTRPKSFMVYDYV